MILARKFLFAALMVVMVIKIVLPALACVLNYEVKKVSITNLCLNNRHLIY